MASFGPFLRRFSVGHSRQPEAPATPISTEFTGPSTRTGQVLRLRNDNELTVTGTGAVRAMGPVGQRQSRHAAQSRANLDRLASVPHHQRGSRVTYPTQISSGDLALFRGNSPATPVTTGLRDAYFSRYDLEVAGATGAVLLTPRDENETVDTILLGRIPTDRLPSAVNDGQALAAEAYKAIGLDVADAGKYVGTEDGAREIVQDSMQQRLDLSQTGFQPTLSRSDR